jgi:putative flippase GtrA
MSKLGAALGAWPLPVKFTLVSALGFAVDATVLHLLIQVGFAAALARLVSLACAMQVTFLVNALFVFRCLDRERPWRQWATYMLTHGFGNFCNYWIFITLLSLHRQPVSAPLVALAIASVLAWTVNYVAARYLVFRTAKSREVASPVTLPFARPHGHEPV